jgi:quinoprotein dehydrogenase-associated probable ABC transporter substrate-binding protein
MKLIVLLLLGTIALAEMNAAPRVLRVCADPDNLPFSNRRGEGFENKIAQLVAGELHASLRYTWMPQRRGFIRRTLKARTCDLVMGVPSKYDLVLPTKPYYRSSYVFVYPASRPAPLRSFDDPLLRDLRIGLHEAGEDGDNQPPAHALARRGVVRNIVGFPMWGPETMESPQGKVIAAVGDGDLDVAIVWGPFAGFFARRQKVPLAVVPVEPGAGSPRIPFVYDIAMGVRPGEDAFRNELEGVIDRRRRDIQEILQQFGVPLIDVNTDSRH